MSKLKAFQRGVDEAIAALNEVCDEFWKDYGLPELLGHLEVVAADLSNGRVKRALEQQGALDEKLLRFSSAVEDYRLQGRVADLRVNFRGAAHDYSVGDLRAATRNCLLEVRGAILGLKEIRATAWEAYGLPELLAHMESVAADLRESKVKRALGQIHFIREKFERFGWAVRGFPIGQRVAVIAATYLGVVIDHFPDENPYSEYVRPKRAGRAERLTRRIPLP